ncbi:hypothetical protein Q0Z83_034500 [Actinoplanes sichuanensis]|uniref:Sigma-70 family RNA polymerase sigma factor n=1 Tax=Actinoplanes sichuanensis TaxID=512349 RepID=A0ABW4ATL5_9ACTN|nr:sigma-70 family RNA polymerase sigma factor [Actinoplanes sichuanensis]BEL05259.1 hypothetical protein Q0Z83_034500 [Actinoplanes sichuanensis]
MSDRLSTVRAAQAGERRALDALIRAHLPLIYTIVGRALDRHADTDDVVQQILLDVVRDLSTLRSPERFRGWLLVITMREINTHLARRDREQDRTEPLDAARKRPEHFEDLIILRLGLDGQRRALIRSARWLDREDRHLFALWSQEIAGRLTRTEVAEALELSAGHTGVRVHRLREQLEIARSVEAALSLSPRCRELDVWDGTRNSLWRKRLARHVRDCDRCSPATADRIAPEDLLAGLGLVALPAALAAAGHLPVPADPAGPFDFPSAGPSDFAPAARLDGAVPVAGGGSFPVAATIAGLTVAAVVTGAVVVTVADEPSPPAAAIAAATPSPSPAVVRPSSPPAPLTLTGTRSLESAGAPGRYLASGTDRATLLRITADTGRRVTFTVVPGLADRDCVSLRSTDGRYLRHYAFALVPADRDPSDLFEKDATFCPTSTTPGRVTLTSLNYPTRTIHHRGDGAVGIDEPDGTTAFTAAATWIIHQAPS